VLPADLGEEDAEDLKELAERVARTRRLLRTFYSSWLKLLEEQLPEAASMFERR
jgi:Mn-dependent DtxR family transcriptional regulator